MADLVKSLESINVSQVLPLLSDITPSLLITPVNPNEPDAVKLTIERISSVLDVRVRDWTSIESGMYYMLRLRHAGITFDVATMIPTRLENSFQLL
jgi:hypothetical protein